MFDVCIICALYEEAKAVLDEFSARCDVSFTKGFTLMDRYMYQHTSLSNKFGESLSILVTWPSDHGPVHTALDLKSILHEFSPRFVAMTGICAGYKRKVKLGDLVVAKYAYHYEEGKIIEGSNGQTVQQPEMKTHGPASQMIQYAMGLDGWREPITEMKVKMLKRPLKSSEEPHCVIEPMASGMAVRADNPFPLLRSRNRNTVALDMEAAAFYAALSSVSHIHGLVVKGVCDYADMTKNDGYHNFAAHASAIYLLTFIQEYVAECTMPRHDVFLPTNRAGPTFFAAKNLYQSWILANTADFRIPGPLGLPLPIETAWTELRVLAIQKPTIQYNPQEQSKYYNEWESVSSHNDRNSYNAKDVAAIGHRVVIKGGPGTGKSTLSRKLAHTLTDLGETVMRIDLFSFANRIRNGMDVNTALVNVSTDAFDAPFNIREALLSQADCLIADGLDECGEEVVLVADALQRWAIAHPSTRIMLTSRPIGYEAKYFSDWQHYGLMPLTQHQVESSSWELIQALVSDAIVAKNQFMRFQERLRDNNIASLAARNPLLLGFLIQLSLEGKIFAEQRAGLYEQILSLWRVSLPQDRKRPVPQVDVLLAWRSLEIVGWLFLLSEKGQNMHSRDLLVRQMSEQLAREMGIQPLQGGVIASNCLQFWHERGVLDCINLGHQEIYTFVHATFNEYAAARYLSSLGQSEIQYWVRKHYSTIHWRETILLAASCGAAEEIVKTLLVIIDENERSSSVLLFAAMVLAESQSVPEPLMQTVINRIVVYLKSADSELVYEAAEQSVSLVKKVPLLFAPLLHLLFHHPQAWTRISAQYLALEAKENIIDVDDIEVLLNVLTAEGLPRREKRAVFSSKGSIMFTLEWSLQNTIVCLCAETLAIARPDSKTKDLLQALYVSKRNISGGTEQRLRDILLELGCEEFIQEQDTREREKFKGGLLDPWNKHRAEADNVVLETVLRLVSPSVRLEPKQSKVRALAILFRTLGISDIPIQDWFILRYRNDIQAFESVFLGYIEILHLSKEELAQDAAWVLAELQKRNQGKMPPTSLLSLLPDFPVKPELPKGSSISVSVENLLRALHHPSLLISYGAAQLLAAVEEGKEEIAVLLSTTNSKRLLGIITSIAGSLWGKEARPLVINRLEQGYISGSCFLVEELPHLLGEHAEPQFQQTLLRALYADDPRMAIASVHALQALDISLVRSMHASLEAALTHLRERGAQAKVTSYYTNDECSTCKAEPGNAYTHLSQLLQRL